MGESAHALFAPNERVSLFLRQKSANESKKNILSHEKYLTEQVSIVHSFAL